MLRPFEPGNNFGGNKGSRYQETQQLARAHSLDAVRTLVERLRDADGRIAVMSASILLERAWGKPREQKPEEERHHIDLSALSAAELKILVDLADSGRLKAIPANTPASGEVKAPTIDAKAE